MKTIAFMLLTAVLATPAMAKHDNSQAARPNKEKQICKRVERTSSHMSTRTTCSGQKPQGRGCVLNGLPPSLTSTLRARLMIGSRPRLS